MRMILLLLVASACADQDPIGTTEWVVPTTAGGLRANPSGRIIDVGMDVVIARDSDGAPLWQQSMLYNDAFDVDRMGNVYVARAEGQAGYWFYKLASADGSTEWRVSLGGLFRSSPRVVVGADDVIWYFQGQPDAVWTRYSSAGSMLATGSVSLGYPRPVALPDGGLLAVNGTGHLITLDATGAITWEGDERVGGFVRHESGEVSAATNEGLLRYAPDHQVRWTHGMDTPHNMQAVGDRLLTSSSEDVSYELDLFDADGHNVQHERFNEQVLLAGAGWDDIYLLTFAGYRSIDLHDRVVPYDGSGESVSRGIAARRLP